MKISENLGTFVLSLWLILTGLFSLLSIYISIMANLLPLMAIIAGLLMLIGSARIPKSLGLLLLAVWLILNGLSPFIYVRIPYFSYLLDLLAIVTGIFLILRR